LLTVLAELASAEMDLAPFQVAETSGVRKVPASIKQAGLSENRYTMGIVTGEPQSTDFTIAYEIAKALATGKETGPTGEMTPHVIPMIENGGVQNIIDLLTLPGADMAIAPVVLVDKVRNTREWGDIHDQMVYIAPLFPEEFHILALAEIRSIRELAGKTVNLDQEGSAGAVLGREIFARLGIKVREVNVDLTAALDGMRNGQISASLLISGKPVKSLTTQTQAEGFHFLEVPYAPDLEHNYLPSALKHADYPNLINIGESVDTISVNSVLMAYNWPPQSERFGLLGSFVRILFSRIAEFQTGPHHPKWQEVNVAATLPGWRRFGPAERWNERKPTEAELRDHCQRHCEKQSPYAGTVLIPLLSLFGR
jgi:TRAP-type uncharacterized transport system substrate-binding protein